jgi:UDP-glucose 4-epimerase
VRIAVTGASGNLGSALLRRLATEVPTGHEVVGVSRRAPERRPAGVTWREVDVGSDDAPALLADAFEGCDAVVHLAWMIQPSHDERMLLRTNVLGSRHVLDAAERAGVMHVVAASSVGAYAPVRKADPSRLEPVDESWPTTGVPTSAYGRHKAELERLLDDLEARGTVAVVTRMRPALVFQAGAASEIARLFLGRLVPTRLAGRVRLPVVPLPRELRFQDVHADDVAEAFRIVLEGRTGGAFNVAAEPVLTPDDIARALGARRAVRLPLRVLRGAAAITWRARLQPSDAGWVDIATTCPVMSTAALRGLGWTPRHDAREALAELVTAMRDGSGDPANPPLHPR